MQKTELTEFAKTWNNYRTIFNHQPLNEDAMLMVFQMFEAYTTAQVMDGMKAALAARKEMPSVADVLEQIRKGQGNGSVDNKHAAEIAFQALNKTAAGNGSHYDWVIEDPKTCAVVRRLWGTPQRFTSLCGDTPRDYANTQRLFLTAWAETSEAEIKDPALPHVFEGKEFDRLSPHVIFCGDYDHCLYIANQFYGKKGILPKLPLEPRVFRRTEPKSEHDYLSSDGMPISNRSAEWMDYISQLMQGYFPKKNGRLLFPQKGH